MILTKTLIPATYGYRQEPYRKMIDFKTWSNVPAKEPTDILRALGEWIATQAAPDINARPFVTLSTRHGQTLSGHLLKVSANKNSDVALLLSDDTGVCELIYVPVDDVSVTRIRTSSQLAPILSFGAVPRPLNEPEPSRLEVKRHVEQIRPCIKAECGLDLDVEVKWQNIPEAAGVLSNIKELADVMAPVVKTSASAPVGRKAWAQISKIVIRHQANVILGVEKADRSLLVTLDVSRALPKPLGKALAEAIEKVL